MVTGQGLTELKDALHSVCARVKSGSDPGLFRMAIDRSFTVAGHGTVVTGTVASGSVAVGDDLACQPAGRLVRVRGLHRHDRPVGRSAEVRARRSTWWACTTPRSAAGTSCPPPATSKRAAF